MDVNLVERWLYTIFDRGDFICPAESLYEINTIPIENFIWTPETKWISLNPFKPFTTRKAGNLLKYQSLLIEIDNTAMDIPQQMDYVLDKIPITSAIYSGNKSVHFIIRLTSAVTKEKYKNIAQRLKLLFPEMDKHCAHPVCFTRFPGAVRDSIEQRLIRLDSRVENEELYKLLPKLPVEKKEKLTKNQIQELSWFAKKLLNEGILPMGKLSRHDKLLNLVLELRRKNYNKDKAKQLTKNAWLCYNNDKTEEELDNLINWVYNEAN